MSLVEAIERWHDDSGHPGLLEHCDVEPCSRFKEHLDCEEEDDSVDTDEIRHALTNIRREIDALEMLL